MASIDKRPGGQYRARWREYPGGPQKTRQFTLDTYSHLWPDSDDETRDAVDEVLGRARAGS
ncbi:MAG: hypothetical protein ABWY57_11650 [Mycetocola sp.]